MLAKMTVDRILHVSLLWGPRPVLYVVNGEV